MMLRFSAWRSFQGPFTSDFSSNITGRGSVLMFSPDQTSLKIEWCEKVFVHFFHLQLHLNVIPIICNYDLLLNSYVYVLHTSVPCVSKLRKANKSLIVCVQIQRILEIPTLWDYIHRTNGVRIERDAFCTNLSHRPFMLSSWSPLHIITRTLNHTELSDRFSSD